MKLSRQQIMSALEEVSKRENIICEGDIYHSSILIPLIETESGFDIIFEKRSKKVSQPGDICFPGGRYELSDADMSVTAVRETVEELGVYPEDIQVLSKLGVLMHQQKSIIHCYVGIIENGQRYKNFDYNPDEVEKVIRIPLERLRQMEPEQFKLRLKAYSYDIDNQGNKQAIFPAKELFIPENYHDEWDMGYRKIVLYELESIKIWGITGQILNHFLQQFTSLE